jgi:IS30 family transposase
MSVRRKNVKNVTEKEYQTVKTLAAANVTSAVISQVTGRSYNTVNFIRKSNSFDEYRARANAQWAKGLKKIVQSGTPNDLTPNLFQLATEISLKVDHLQESVDKLLEEQEIRDANEKANRWKFGGSR